LQPYRLINKTTKTVLEADRVLNDQELLEEAFLQISPAAQIHAVSSGKEAFAYVQRCGEAETACLILLDYNMPCLNRPQVVGQLATVYKTA
jgi:CheY-like chemotaxis protein